MSDYDPHSYLRACELSARAYAEEIDRRGVVELEKIRELVSIYLEQPAFYRHWRDHLLNYAMKGIKGKREVDRRVKST